MFTNIVYKWFLYIFFSQIFFDKQYFNKYHVFYRIFTKSHIFNQTFCQNFCIDFSERFSEGRIFDSRQKRVYRAITVVATRRRCFRFHFEPRVVFYIINFYPTFRLFMHHALDQTSTLGAERDFQDFRPQDFAVDDVSLVCVWYGKLKKVG